MDFDTFMILASCLGIFLSITSFRKYRRNGLRCHLFISLGAAWGSIGFISIDYLGFTHRNDFINDLFIYFFIIPGIILFMIGRTLIYTVESGAVQESYRGLSILDRMLGNVLPLVKEKEYKPAMSPEFGMLMGIVVIVGGIARCMDKDTTYLPSIYFFLIGMPIFIVSLFTLYGEKIEKEERKTTAISEEQKADIMLEFYSDFEKQRKANMRECYYDIIIGIILSILGSYKCYQAYPDISYFRIYIVAAGFISFARALYLYWNWR
jgi:hypothetical protein